MRPGTSWFDMQTLSYRVILTHLRDAGVLTGDVDEMMAVNMGAGACARGGRGRGSLAAAAAATARMRLPPPVRTR